MLKRFIKYYKPYKGMFILDMIASLFISLIGLCYPILTNKLLKDIIPGNYELNEKLKFIIIFSIFLILIYIIRLFLRYFVQYYGHVIGVKIQRDMRNEMFKKLQKLPYSFYDRVDTGSIISRITSDLFEVSELAHHGPENIFICLVTIILSFIYLFMINYTFALFILLLIPFLVIVSLFYKKRMNSAFLESRKKVSLITSNIESSITGIRLTKAFSNNELELEKFKNNNEKYVKIRSKAYKAMGGFFASTNFITDMFNFIILIIGGILALNQKIDVATYVTFVISINLFITPLTTLINFTEQYQNGVTGFKRFLEIMDESEEIWDQNSKDLEIKGDIEFKNVSFKYKDELILDNISFKINNGEKIALVGSSGGGKTTICHLIPAFYQINEGNILIDNMNQKSYSLNSLRGQIGIVQQDVFLFNDTIFNNVLYGNITATKEEVIEACKKAKIHDFIMSLENTYDTIVGERGVLLSGGQKQRISIARVFLKNPKILILDEATSALDNETEKLISESLDELAKDRTTIIVAHRLSTIKNVDRVIVIKDKIINQIGKYEDLLNIDGEFKRLNSF